MADRRPAIVLTTLADRTEAEHMADTLVAEKLAACVNRVGVASTYRWQGGIEHAEEVLLVIKTATDLWPLLRARIQEISSYQVPEVLEIDVSRGDGSYLRWLFDCVPPPRTG